MIRRATLLISLALVMGCASDQLVRMPDDVTFPTDVPAEAQQRLPVSLEHHGTYTLGVIEFSDSGELRSTTQKDSVLNELDTLAHRGSLTLVVFVHGWHHGAQVGDSNVDSFREILR